MISDIQKLMTISLAVASYPGSLGGGEREPGNHCTRMRQSYQQNLVSGLVEAG